MANYATRHKHNHVVLIVIIVIIVLIIVIPVALIGILWYLITDTSRLDKNFDTGLTFSEVLDDMVFDALKFEEDDEGNTLFVMRMSDDQLSEAMHTMLEEYINSIGMIDNYYVQMYDDTMDIAVEASIADLVYTKVTIRCTLTTEIDEEDPLNSCIFFSIDELIIGQLDGLRDIALDIVELFFSLEDMVDSFKDAGFSLEYNPDEVAFTYKFSDFLDDMLTGVDMGNATLYINSFIDTLIDYNLLHAGVSDNDLVISVDVTGFISEDRGDEIDLVGVMEKVEYLYSIGTVTSDDEANAVLVYLVYGWNGIASDQQSIVSRLDLSAIGISNDDKTDFTGEKGKYDGDINTIMEGIVTEIDGQQILLDALNSGEEYNSINVASISLKDISSYLGSLSFNGSSYYMIRDEEVRGIGVTNIMCYYDEVRQVFTIGISLCFSGDIINIGIEYELVPEDKNELRLYYSGNYMGGYEMSRDSISEYMAMVSDSMGSIEWFFMDSDYFVVNLNLDVNSILGDYALYVDDFYLNYELTSEAIEVTANFSLDDNYIYGQFHDYIYDLFLKQGDAWDYPGVVDFLANDWQNLLIAYLEDETEDKDNFYLYFYTKLREYFATDYVTEGGQYGNYMVTLFDKWLEKDKGITVGSDGNLHYITTSGDGDGDGGDTQEP